MKHILFMLFLLPATLMAQNFGGGAILGANFSQIDGDTDAGFRQVGLSVGGFVRYDLNDRFFLQPEIKYEQLGSRQRQGFFVIRSHHISIPILLTTNLGIDLGEGNQEIQLEAGPVVGILLGASERISGNDQSTIFRNPDFRAVAGGTYRFSERWSFSLRYGYSIFSFLRRNPPNTFPLDASRGGLFHNYVALSFRYHLAE